MYLNILNASLQCSFSFIILVSLGSCCGRFWWQYSIHFPQNMEGLHWTYDKHIYFSCHWCLQFNVPNQSTYVKFINENTHSPGERKISYFFNTSTCISISGISQNSNSFLSWSELHNCYNKLPTKTSPYFITKWQQAE